MFRERSIEAAFLPSYAPLPEAAVWVAAQILGVKSIMMNESHAGTERATGWKRWVKRRMIGRFDAALVGGAPQKRHFANLGIPEECIFTGYDAVDNELFASEAEKARGNAQGVRAKLCLPERYFLSLGRMVEKKNLGVLVESYAQFCAESEEEVALVMVGSGDEEAGLRAQAARLGMKVHDASDLSDIDRQALGQGDVVFYGFRQIDENPLFFALAEAFVLPSLWEEWGLVVNEAMACGVPLLVSRTVGCAEDLVEDNGNGFTFAPSSASELSQRLSELAAGGELRQRFGRCSEKIIATWGCENFARNALRALDAATGRS
ncbi:MAG: glycosyltransferase family 4 protein [Verrucomicrobiota bacterium]